MSTLNGDKEVVLDGLTKTIARHDARHVIGRRKFRTADVRQTQILLEETFILLKHTLKHIEKSYEVIARSQALLEEMKRNETRRADHAGHRKELSIMLATRTTP